MKRIYQWIGLVCVLGLLGACASDTEEKTSESFALDTICTQSVYGQNAQDAIDAVNTMLWDITTTMSMNEGSYIYEINAAASDAVEVTQEVSGLLQTALDIARETDGAFDPTIGVITALWNISEDPRVPEEEEIENVLPLVDYQQVTVDGTDVALGQSGMVVDLGGIAKGYAADQAVQIYEEYGIQRALLNLGGNIYAPTGQSRTGAITGLVCAIRFGSEGEYAAVIGVHDTSVVTSGVYERYFESDGQIYHHIFDPDTGYPTDNGLAAVTVICASSTRADALSTALFVMGLEEGLAFADADPDIEAVFFTDDYKI